MEAPTGAGRESHKDTCPPDAGAPGDATPVVVQADDVLVLPKPQRVVTHYATAAAGGPTLHLYYGDKAITFDEPALFAFGEGLTQHARFVARTATTWGAGYDWPRVQELLEQLLAEGILQHGEATEAAPLPVPHGVCPSPLPAAPNRVPRTWMDCEAITRELTGHAVEVGYLELVVPIFRVAHMLLDAEGRQVGEANVFPPALRLEVPTEWRPCPYAGSRFDHAQPMNVTALKSMRQQWPQMLVALARIRAAYLRRFPQARAGWTVGDLERLATLVLAVPTYLLMRTPPRVANGALPPVFSALFRVTDGLRMTMHQMLFVPTVEATLPPEAPMTSAEIYAYAERNGSFLSAHGVCAGPKAMIETFLHVLVDGQPVAGRAAVVLDGPVQAALADLDAAFAYGLYGLQAHAVVFSLWPAMSRAYEQLWAIVDAWSGVRSALLVGFRDRLQRDVHYLQTSTLLRTEAWRASRERVYADMYAHCARGLDATAAGATLPERLAPGWTADHAQAAAQLRTVLRRRLGGAGAAESPAFERLVTGVLDYARQEQAIVRVACAIQERINALLGRTPPVRPFTAAAIDLFHRLQGDIARLPYLGDELEAGLGLRLVVTRDTITCVEGTAGAAAGPPLGETHGQQGAG